MAGVGNGRGHAGAFLAEEQDIIGHETEIVDRSTALRGEQHHPSRTDNSPERGEVGVSRYGDMIDIVHGGSAYSAIIPREAHRLDKVHSRAHTGTKAQNGTDVSGNFRFEESNAHSGLIGCGERAMQACGALFAP